MSNHWGVFLLFLVGGSLVLASLLLAFPGGPAYEQTYVYDETVDEVPIDATDIAYLDELPDREQSMVKRALDGETVRAPAHRELPPTVVVNRSSQAVHLFTADRHYDLDKTSGKAGLIAFVGGLAAVVTAVRRDHRR